MDKIPGQDYTYVMKFLQWCIIHPAGLKDITGHAKEHAALCHFEFVEINADADVAGQAENSDISVNPARIFENIRIILISDVSKTDGFIHRQAF